MAQKLLRSETQAKAEAEDSLVGVLLAGSTHVHQQNQHQPLKGDLGLVSQGQAHSPSRPGSAEWWRDSAMKGGKQAATSGIAVIKSIGRASSTMKLNLSSAKGRK